jgi:hypothetical protein
MNSGQFTGGFSELISGEFGSVVTVARDYCLVVNTATVRGGTVNAPVARS